MRKERDSRGWKQRELDAYKRCLRGKIPKNLVVCVGYTDEEDDSGSSLSQLVECCCHSHR